MPVEDLGFLPEDCRLPSNFYVPLQYPLFYLGLSDGHRVDATSRCGQLQFEDFIFSYRKYNNPVR